jgi:hypothetical protein
MLVGCLDCGQGAIALAVPVWFPHLLLLSRTNQNADPVGIADRRQRVALLRSTCSEPVSLAWGRCSFALGPLNAVFLSLRKQSARARDSASRRELSICLPRCSRTSLHPGLSSPQQRSSVWPQSGFLPANNRIYSSESHLNQIRPREHGPQSGT